MRIGYTTGVFDLFHVGHVRLLRRAKEQCDFLIVGVTTDELVSYKGKKAVIPLEQRMEVVASVKWVDKVVEQSSMNKMQAWKEFRFNVMFVGDDWKGTEKWNQFEAEFAEVGTEIVYFPYTKETSSTLINKTLSNLRKSGTE